MTFTLGTIDLVVVAVYAVFIVALGVWLGRQHEDAEQYFLAGRRMIWPVIGISLYASNMGSTALVGLSGDAYATGISVFNYEWMAAVVLVFFAVFLAPFYIRSRVYTMPEFLERRYDARSRYYFSGLTLFGNIVIDTAGHLYAGGLVLKLIFPEIPLGQTIAVLAVLAGIYTILGGLVAVMFTDVIQTALLLIGAIIVSIVAFDQVGSWE
ncbi:MAG TPA: sodium transporter, partial [Alphaproteobacteria bacterium]|nr:sodium transporter [Alphaproteobacteria bacterium]